MLAAVVVVGVDIDLPAAAAAAVAVVIVVVVDVAAAVVATIGCASATGFAFIRRQIHQPNRNELEQLSSVPVC